MTGRLRLGEDVDLHPQHGQAAAARRRPATPTMTVMGCRSAKTIGFIAYFFPGDNTELTSP